MKRAVLSHALEPVLVVAGMTVILWLTREKLEHSQVALIYVLVVACVAARGGTASAVVTAILSFLNIAFFFLPPIFSFRVADPRDWLMLVAFLVIGVLVGSVTGRLRERQQEARARESELTALLSATLALSVHTEVAGAFPCLIEQIVKSTRASRCMVIQVQGDSLEILAGDQDLSSEVRVRSRQVAQEGKACRQRWPDCYLPLLLGSRSHGVLYAAPAQGLAFTPTDHRLLIIFAGQAAAFLERHRLLGEATAAGAAQEAERLKSTLFSSLSHNLKTPLASLNATVSSLRQEDVIWEPAELKESLSLIAEDVSRLTDNIENLLSLARLEAGGALPQKEWVGLEELVELSLRFLNEESYRRVAVQIEEDSPIWIDSLQMAQVLRHLVENALAYSLPSSPVWIEAGVRDSRLELHVLDQGPGIPEAERRLVFDKFYRGSAAGPGAVRGTGLGLSICKEIISAHGGSIAVGDSPAAGARLSVFLPIPQQSRTYTAQCERTENAA